MFLGCQHGQYRRDFGHAVGLAELDSGRADIARSKALSASARAIGDEPKGRKVERAEPRMFQKHRQHGRDEYQHMDTVFFDGVRDFYNLKPLGRITVWAPSINAE
ncbi:MAG: hypothetical protein Ct9H300mP16_10130 [Pseudomonadota bacterium]|nr:MAG: hypothetical protein Ct9H300mP16_10130 [Pseudomonadota bacterium]